MSFDWRVATRNTKVRILIFLSIYCQLHLKKKINTLLTWSSMKILSCTLILFIIIYRKDIVFFSQKQKYKFTNFFVMLSHKSKIQKKSAYQKPPKEVKLDKSKYQ